MDYYHKIHYGHTIYYFHITHISQCLPSLLIYLIAHHKSKKTTVTKNNNLIPKK